MRQQQVWIFLCVRCFSKIKNTFCTFMLDWNVQFLRLFPDFFPLSHPSGWSKGFKVLKKSGKVELDRIEVNSLAACSYIIHYHQTFRAHNFYGDWMHNSSTASGASGHMPRWENCMKGMNISLHLLAVLCTNEASNGAEVVEVCAV